MNNQQNQQNQQNMQMYNRNQQQIAGNYQQPNGSITQKLFEGSPLLDPSDTSIATLRKKNQQVIRQQMPTPSQQNNYKTQKNIKKDRDDETTTDTTDDISEKQKHSKIKHLVKDLNKSLDDYLPSKAIYTDDSDEEQIEVTKSEHKKNNFFNGLIKESVIIFLLFMLISQNFFRRGISYYIPKMIGENGTNLSMTGHIITGLILVLLYSFFKFAIIH